ncbi:peptidylprolyl isomerase [Mangrovibacterium sp.]|uniref:peptidylprolyl isomerase n=1 Tax=Mangrovibacterium sp. TaxID=1961364 RepID=UPI003561A15F
MKKYIINLCLWSVVMASSVAAFGQSKNQALLTIGNESISKEEFVRLYKKNNQNLLDDSLRKSPTEYIDLFINYKLKVKQAEDLGLDTLKSFQNEFLEYRNQLAKPYLSNSTITDEALMEAYRRMKSEVKASHILIRLAPDANQQAQDAAYDQCLKIRDQAIKGVDFAQLARQYSEDPSAAKNGGLLGYFSAFQMVPEFEEAAFNLKTGEISMPVRSDFGFHLILVHDKRDNTGQLQVAHIMKRLPKVAVDKDVESAKNEIDSLKKLLDTGTDFAALARRFSDDKQSAANGGVLPWFSNSSMMPEFADPAFALQQIGDISPVIRTPYGFHLIQLIGKKPVPDFDELKPFITEKLKSNPIVTKKKQAEFIEHLKAEYNFKEDTSLRNQLLKHVEAQDTSYGSWQNENLMQIGSQTYQPTDFMKYAGNRKKSASSEQLYAEFVSDMLLETENRNLETKYPEFRYLIQEYHDGILLFNLSEETIWNTAGQDSVGLLAFYEKNKDLFKWDSRFDGWVIQCNNQDVRDYIEGIFAEDANIAKGELTDLLKLNDANQAFIQKGIFARGDNNIVDYLVWHAPKPQNFNDSLHFVRGNLIPPTPKKLEEARGQYLSAYQDELEKQWILDLRKKYPVRVNKKVLKTIEPVK